MKRIPGEHNPERILARSIAYQGTRVLVEHLRIDFGNGKEETFELIGFRGGGHGVMCVPIDADDNVLFVEQYLSGSDERVLVLPRGGLPPGTDPSVHANIELQEEAKVAAGRLTPLGPTRPLSGYVQAESQVYLAEELSPSALEGDEVEDLSIRKIPLVEAAIMAANGEIIDTRTSNAILMVYVRRQLEAARLVAAREDEAGATGATAPVPPQPSASSDGTVR